MNITTISELNQDQIAEINAFLEGESKAAFTDEQINFLTNIGTMDVLGLATHCNLIRGYMGSFDHIYPALLLVNEDGEDSSQLMDEFVNTVRKSDFEKEDYQAILDKQKAIFKAQMAHHGIILTSGLGRSDVLFLNKEFKPLYTNFVVFNNCN